jgi:hypothetical protein
MSVPKTSAERRRRRRSAREPLDGERQRDVRSRKRDAVGPAAGEDEAAGGRQLKHGIAEILALKGQLAVWARRVQRRGAFLGGACSRREKRQKQQQQQQQRDGGRKREPLEESEHLVPSKDLLWGDERVSF